MKYATYEKYVDRKVNSLPIAYALLMLKNGAYQKHYRRENKRGLK